MATAFVGGAAFCGRPVAGGQWGVAGRRGCFVVSTPVVKRCKVAETPRCSVAGGLVQAGSTMAGLAILAVTILVHETGHFLAARSRGIEVQNFSVGFGPKLWSYVPKGSDTEFTLRAIPLGGFVSFPNSTYVDEKTGETVTSKDPNLLPNRPVRDRALVVSAGVIANIVLAWSALFVSISSYGLPTVNYEPGVLVAQLTDANGNAAKAGIMPGDVVLSLDGNKIGPNPRSAADLAASIRHSNGRMMSMELQRGNDILNLNVESKCCTPNGESVLGVQLSARGTLTRQRPENFAKTIGVTNQEFVKLADHTFTSLKSIVTNFGENAKRVSGPIGVVSMGAELARNDQASLLQFCADISMNLAIVNSLPLPALDGGQMFFLVAEAARGSPVSPKVQEAVNRTAILMFLVFSSFLLFGDIEKLFG